MHEQTFPHSDEPVDRQTERARQALEYEESAGLGFRRVEREFGVTSEHLPGATVELGESPAALTAAWIAAAGLLLGLTAMVYKPLIFGLAGFVAALIGVAAGGRAESIGRRAMVVLGLAVVVGMWFHLAADRPLF